MTLDDLLTNYRLEHPNVGKSGMQQYRIAVTLFERWLARPAVVGDLTNAAVGGFMIDYHNDGATSPTTVNKKRQTLVMLANHAFLDGLIERPVTVVKMREEQALPNALSVADMERVIEACRNAKPLPIRPYWFHQNRWFPDHWEGLIRTVYETGHRLDCLLTCETSALTADGFLRMKAAGTKSKKEQVHKLTDDLVDLLRQLRPKHKLLFPWPLSKRGIWKNFAKHIAEPAGIPCDRLHKFHCVRRTSGTLFRANSDNEQAVADHMGHENFKITRKFYIDPTKAYPDRVYASDVLPRIGERRPLAGESGT